MKNFDQFHTFLNCCNSDESLSPSEVVEALHNLTGFMSLLIQINERENIISFEQQNNKDDYENQ